MSGKKITWCKNCLNMSTRPRITFDERGWCNACQWMHKTTFMHYWYKSFEFVYHDLDVRFLDIRFLDVSIK
jgi:hypothetical protein